MSYIQILSCSNDLGNCCNDKALLKIWSITSNVLSIIQIVVPILLLIVVTISLAKLMIDPDNNKELKAIKNKFIAAVIVFFIPVFINAAINITSESSSKSLNFVDCLKEAKNVKIDMKSKYIPIDEKGTVPIVPTGDYEEGTPSKESIGDKISSRVCTVGDKSVKLVYNDSHAEAKISRKVNGQEVVDYAKSWIGKMSYEFTAQGPLKVGGKCSCSHFVYQVLKHFDMIEGNFIRSTVWGSCNVKGTTIYSDYSKLVPGDVVFMTLGGTAGHVGIYAGNGKVIDCNTGTGVRTSNAKNYTAFIHLNAYD